MNSDSVLRFDHVRDIYAWLDEIPLSRPKRNVARDFSDGVLMAEILKRYYPKYVDVKNYIPTCNTTKKIDNWYTLNRKVFSKLNVKLSNDVINKLAQSQLGLIEKVLYEVRTKIIKDCNNDRNSLFEGCEDISLDEYSKVITNPEESLNQTVPCKMFIKLKKELEEKKHTIEILEKKNEHLETMLRLKEQQIEDLTTQIQSKLALVKAK